MVKPEWGIKRLCQSCGARYYDFQKTPIVCPSCGTTFDSEAVLKSRRARPLPADDVKPKARKVVAEEVEEVEEEEEEEEEELDEAEAVEEDLEEEDEVVEPGKRLPNVDADEVEEEEEEDPSVDLEEADDLAPIADDEDAVEPDEEDR